jgi:phosphopentomutase
MCVLICIQNTGTEQHRHHAVEIALYNLFSYLWELETLKVYEMTKANDIYSGLGVEQTVPWATIGMLQETDDMKLTSTITKEETSPIVIEIGDDALEEKVSFLAPVVTESLKDDNLQNGKY